MTPAITMYKEQTIEELKFALEHDLKISKSNVHELLDEFEAREIADTLNLEVDVTANFFPPEGDNEGFADYTMHFSRDCRVIGRYSTRPLVSTIYEYHYCSKKHEGENACQEHSD